MGAFDYLAVLVSIIVGLAITQLLTGWRGMVLARARVTSYWPLLVWTVVVLLVCVQSWWAMFGLRALATWTFADFAIVLAQAIVLYMLAALALPDFGDSARVDLAAHYFDHRRLFFGALVVLIAISLAKDMIIAGRLPSATNVAFQACIGAGAVGAMLTRRPWYHAALAPAALAVFAAYIATLFARLP
jgi:hypothetical protein